MMSHGQECTHTDLICPYSFLQTLNAADFMSHIRRDNFSMVRLWVFDTLAQTKPSREPVSGVERNWVSFLVCWGMICCFHYYVKITLNSSKGHWCFTQICTYLTQPVQFVYSKSSNIWKEYHSVAEFFGANVACQMGRFWAHISSLNMILNVKFDSPLTSVLMLFCS